ncbi:MAG TPA: cytochrome c peroxidase [Bacteroidales bacterium]|nr:cytochrome c peroxidase [Bacteroidales bacterium]HRW95230.1 cytochrome c peroxidase [Bacteroidales bacterium]
MKRFLNILWKFTGSVIILIGTGIFFSRIVNQVPPEDMTLIDRVNVIVDQGGCFICHGGPHDFCKHINWPVFGAAISKDAFKGIRYANSSYSLAYIFGDMPNDETSLIKLQKVISQRSMPPLSYYVIHWKAYLTRDKQEILLDWIYDQLSSYHSYVIPTEEYPFEPVKPVLEHIPHDTDKAALGELLFHDSRLSVDNTVSCASCHNLKTGGVDNLDFSVGVYNQPETLNSLTVYNTVFHSFYFWSGKASSLQELVYKTLLDPVKMGNDSLDRIFDIFSEDSALTERFLASYPEGYSDSTITHALAEFHKTLITPNAPFDKYLKGDAKAIGQQAQEGYLLFKKHGCATCHNGTGMGATSFEYMGVANNYFPDTRRISLEDMGRYSFTSLNSDMHRFRVPGLRNIALTSPYFHNASAKTMEEAVVKMAYYQRDKKLSRKQVQAIVSYLNTLTGEHEGIPLKNINGEENKDIVGHSGQ